MTRDLGVTVNCGVTAVLTLGTTSAVWIGYPRAVPAGLGMVGGILIALGALVFSVAAAVVRHVRLPQGWRVFVGVATVCLSAGGGFLSWQMFATGRGPWNLGVIYSAGFLLACVLGVRVLRGPRHPRTPFTVVPAAAQLRRRDQ